MTDTHTEIVGARLIEFSRLNQYRAQDLLMQDHAPAEAPTLLLSWAEVVDSAATLWSGLPPTGHIPTDLLMSRLSGMAAAMDSSLRHAVWRTVNGPDDQLLTIADTFTQAADLLKADGSHLERVDADRIRAAVAATIHVGGHLIGQTAAQYVADARTITDDRVRRRQRPHTRLVDDAAARLAAFGEVSAAAGRLQRPAGGGSTDQQLASSLAVWQVQAHRTLARQPTVANLMVMAQTEQRIARVAGRLFEARAVVADAPDTPTPRILEQAASGWEEMAAGWRAMLAGDAALHLDPALLRAGHRIRAVSDAVLTPVQPPADPAFAAAFSVDLDQAHPTIQSALGHSTTLARGTRDVLDDLTSPLQAPARLLAERALELAGRDVAWVDLRAVHRHHLTTLPPPIRQHLAAAYDVLADQLSWALSESAHLDAHPPLRIRSTAPDPHVERRRREAPAPRPSPPPTGPAR